jgi:hypothetical protein
MKSPKAIGRIKAAFTVPLTIIAWLLLSNHCALGAIAPPTEAAPESAGCPMHSAPAKKKPATKTPCCKDLRAIVAKWVGANAVGLRVISSQNYAPEIFPQPGCVAVKIEGLDTGPPGCLSFAESVLQESMLSHAPPVS